jgi:hypothetical protein
MFRFFTRLLKFHLICTFTLFVYFSPGLALKLLKEDWNIKEKTQLEQYQGYVVKRKKTDWFGHWVTAKKGRKEIVLRCEESIFQDLVINKPIGR